MSWKDSVDECIVVRGAGGPVLGGMQVYRTGVNWSLKGGLTSDRHAACQMQVRLFVKEMKRED